MLVAVKKINKIKLKRASKTQQTLFADELHNLQLVDHPNIIKILEITETLPYYHFVYEFAAYGTIKEQMIKQNGFSQEYIKSVMKAKTSFFYEKVLHIFGNFLQNFCHFQSTRNFMIK